MKKILILSISAILVLSCTLNLFVPQATPAPTVTIPPTETSTFTPIPPTSTFTVTPTLVGSKIKTETPTPDFTPTQSTETPIFLITPDTPTLAIEMKGFVTVNISANEFYKGTECQPSSVKFIAQVADPVNTAFVLLSVRFKSKQTGTTSKWTTIAMQTFGAGTFTYDLISDVMIGVDLFENAWVQYQLVATNTDAKEIGRTGIFSERLTLLECVPTPTPTPSPEPTVLRP